MQTITKVYTTYNKAHRAVDELVNAGVPMSEISVLGNREVSEQYEEVEDLTETGVGAGASLGAVVGGAAGLLAGLGLMAIPGLGPVVAAGWLATTVVGAAAGGAAGGIVGTLISLGVTEEHADVYSEAVRRGGTLVSVKAEDHDVAKVQAILGKFTPIDPVAQADAYRETGWRAFDPDAGPYESIHSSARREKRLI